MSEMREDLIYMLDDFTVQSRRVLWNECYCPCQLWVCMQDAIKDYIQDVGRDLAAQKSSLLKNTRPLLVKMSSNGNNLRFT